MPPGNEKSHSEVFRMAFFMLKKLLVELREDIAEIDFLGDDRMEILDLHALLLHRITVTDSYATVVK